MEVTTTLSGGSIGRTLSSDLTLQTLVPRTQSRNNLSASQFGAKRVTRILRAAVGPIASAGGGHQSTVLQGFPAALLGYADGVTSRKVGHLSFFQLTQGAALACAGLGAAAATTRTRAMYRFWTTSQVGTRDLIYIPIPEVVFDDLRGRTADQKTTVDQLAADLLAAITGHPELVRDLDREARCPTSLLAHAIDTRRAHPDIGTRIRTEVRIPLPVSAEIRAWTVTRASDAGQIAADLLAIATGHPEGVRHLDRLDMLRLASATLFATVDGITAGAHGRCTE